MNKLEQGKETRLSTLNEAYGYNLPDDPDHPLQTELENLQKNIELSGGETQGFCVSVPFFSRNNLLVTYIHLSRARSFMCFDRGKVRFVAVDEPTSVLDSEGEFVLFDNLIRAREGKTMVFVTHRFGHLTNCTDLVVY